MGVVFRRGQLRLWEYWEYWHTTYKHTQWLLYSQASAASGPTALPLDGYCSDGSVVNGRRGTGREERRRRGGSLLLSPPHDDHAGGVGRRQQALVAVEADVQHGAAVTLQLVDDGLGVALHVEEVDAGVLAAGHCGRSARRSIRGPEETPRLCTAWRANPKFLP